MPTDKTGASIDLDGYNMHLPAIPALSIPSIAEAKERKRLERAEAWHRRESVKQYLKWYRSQRGDAEFIHERLSGALQAPGGSIRRVMGGTK